MALQWKKLGKGWEADHHGGFVVVDRCSRTGRWSAAFQICGQIECDFDTAAEARDWANDYLRTDCPPAIQHLVLDPSSGEEVPF